MTLEENEAKLCSKCKKNHRQGNQRWCKQCISESNRQYRLAHKEEAREYFKNWYASMDPRIKKRYLKKCADKREEIRNDPERYRLKREKAHEYYLAHREKFLAYNHEYYAKNREELLRQRREKRAAMKSEELLKVE